MKYTLVSMYRNERKNVSRFMEHVHSLFDEIHLISHRSVDETDSEIRRWCSSSSKIKWYSYSSEGRHQSELMSYILNKISERNLGWVFFLDFDEYLPFSDKKSFDAIMKGNIEKISISMRWLNLIPYYDSKGDLIIKESLCPKKPSNIYKVAINSNLINKNEKIVVHSGNHSASYINSGKVISSTDSFPIFHIPILNSDSLVEKIENGLESYNKNIKDNFHRYKKTSSHWHLMKKMAIEGSYSENLMNGLISTYGETKKQNDLILREDISISLEKLRSNGWSEVGFNLSNEMLGEEIYDNKNPVEISWEDIKFPDRYYNPSYLNKIKVKYRKSVRKRLDLLSNFF